MKSCEHCGAPLDQYNGPLKYELGQELVVQDHIIPDWNGQKVMVIGIDRRNGSYPNVYKVEFLNDNHHPVLMAEKSLTNISTI